MRGQKLAQPSMYIDLSTRSFSSNNRAKQGPLHLKNLHGNRQYYVSEILGLQ